MQPSTSQCSNDTVAACPGKTGNELRGNQTMRRLFGTIGFAVAGIISVIAWASIDSRLCVAFDRLCVPPAGSCGGGVDACAATTLAAIELFAYLFGPPVLFAVLGACLFSRRRPPHVIVAYLACAVAAHWLVTFAGVRLLHV
ncbi:hypothetical protein [Burkholderia sp. BCC0405]|uniref:hypothetical protein n=1 Tax=Burkholderia sp. BCC0405 TaxID=2676298 RepID=UPI001FC8E7FB|nr:hypothetical protein [Burkholderia sp. BCC0405]